MPKLTLSFISAPNERVQGLTPKKMKVEELFAESTLDL